MTSGAADRVGALLAAAYGSDVAISRTQRIRPWSVLRAEIDAPAPDLPASVIVKWLRDTPGDLRTDPDQVRRERDALVFLARVGFEAAPRLLADDLANNLLVLEDLRPRVALDELLRRREPSATAGLSAFARTVARMHALTAGREIPALAARPPGPLGRLRDVGWLWEEVLPHAERLGATVPGPARAELDAVTGLLADPGPFLALSNGDSNPNNFLFADGAGAVIDFENAYFRHALLDLTWIHVPGPMWVTVNNPDAVRLEDAYREVLVDTVPQAGDDAAFGPGMAAACLAAAAERLRGFPRLDQRPPGHQSRVQRVATLESAAEVADRHRCLPHLAGWARAVASGLRRRWPDADVDWRAYPRYAPRT